jgi:hypothetical protein
MGIDGLVGRIKNEKAGGVNITNISMRAGHIGVPLQVISSAVLHMELVNPM